MQFDGKMQNFIAFRPLHEVAFSPDRGKRETQLKYTVDIQNNLNIIFTSWDGQLLMR